MNIAVFGANGPTGQLLCLQALAAGHHVKAASRRADAFAVAYPNFQPVRADVASSAATGVRAAVQGCEAVLSVLGSSYTRKPIDVYSVGTRNIVEAMRAEAGCRRLVVVSSGLTFAAPPSLSHGWFFDHVMHPILRDGFGRTLYEDMRRMEDYLQHCDDIDWTVMRPGRLTNDVAVSRYRIERDFPTRRYTSRADLAASMLAELTTTDHVRQAICPTTR